MSLNYCPYEIENDISGFRKIDLNKLAYEMIFFNGYTYKDFCDAVSGTMIEDTLIQSGVDKKGAAAKDSTIRYMMRAPKAGEKIGPEQLIDLVQGEYDEEAVPDIFADDDENEDGSLLDLQCSKTENGVYVVSLCDENGVTKPVANLIPCCPNCHGRLPVDYLIADDFIGVSMNAPKGGGKTTYITSLFVNNFVRMRNLGNNVSVSPAHYSVANPSHGSADTAYEEKKAAARKLEREGILPPPTNTDALIRPVFLKVRVPDGKGGQKLLIVGLYDNSGEVLAQEGLDTRTMMLANMYGQIYMIEPEQLGIRVSAPAKNKKESAGNRNAKIRLLSLEEQGEYQEENKDLVFTGEALLTRQTVTTEEPEEEEEEVLPLNRNIVPPMELLITTKQMLEEIQVNDCYDDQHIAFTIIKCDLLEGHSVMRKGDRGAIFHEDYRCINLENLWNDTAAAVNNDMMREIFEELVFNGPKGRLNKTAYRASVANASKSWHLVSALGTGTEEIDDYVFQLTGDYDPIRLEEPLATCIIKRIKENGWR